jgi:tetratricopeptide (TPR) repeat protein
LVGIGGVICAWLFSRRSEQQRPQFDAALWRLWGRVGCAVALAAYLIEYAPSHFSLRLEVNNPLYALAWLSGAEIVAMTGERWATGTASPLWRTILSAAGLLAAPAAIVAGGSSAFVLLDSRLLGVHRHIAEFMSLRAAIQVMGERSMSRFVIDLVLLLPVLLVFLRREVAQPLIVFASVVVVGAAALACWQFRWWMTASGPELCLLLAAMAVVAGRWGQRACWIVVVVLSAFFVQHASSRVLSMRANVEDGRVTASDAMQPIYRDAAVAIRKSQPSGEVILLSSPNASTAIGYFGQFKTIGTLYWENLQGLAAASEILSSVTDEQAHTLIRARKITHIAVFSKDDFLEEYLEFDREQHPNTRLEETFGYRILYGGKAPRWLRPIPFRLGAVAAESGLTVHLFQVVPEQTDLEAAWASAIAQIGSGDLPAAERSFHTAISLVGRDRQAELYGNAASLSYQNGAHALAVVLLDSALSISNAASLRQNLAWILATSRDDRVRDTARALSLSESIAKANPNDETALDVYAAALAATGRYPAAIQAAERMQKLAESSGHRDVSLRAEGRLRVYREGRPWRQ